MYIGYSQQPIFGSCEYIYQLEKDMSEKDLIKLWLRMRSQIIMAQIAPSLVLIGIFTIAAFGKFETASDGTKYLAIGVAAVTGILAIISQYAAVREGESVVEDLAKISGKSFVGSKISNSRGLLSISATAITGFGIAVFALVVWAVLG
jgi:hypothetical protein